MNLFTGYTHEYLLSGKKGSMEILRQENLITFVMIDTIDKQSSSIKSQIHSLLGGNKCETVS